MSDHRYPFWVFMFLLSGLVAVSSPVVRGQWDGSTFAGVGLLVLAGYWLARLRHEERARAMGADVPVEPFDDLRHVLAFAERFPSRNAYVNELIFREFGVSACRFDRRVREFADTPEALVYAPVLVRRIHTAS